VIKYILSQEGHHKKRSFKEEFLEMLEKNEIIYGNEYLLNFSIIVMNRKKYSGALHLGFHSTNSFLQMFCSSAALNQVSKVRSIENICR
jgi:hypothetical protein